MAYNFPDAPVNGDITQTAGQRFEWVAASTRWEWRGAALLNGTTGVVVPATNTWTEAAATLTSTSCVQLSLDNATWSQSIAVSTGTVFYTRWDPGAACDGAPNGTTISGTITDSATGAVQTYTKTIGATAASTYPFDWQSVAGNPTTLGIAARSDASALVDGDQAWDSTNNKLYAWDAGLSAWGLVGPSGAASGADVQAAAAAPTFKSDGVTALTAGDIWYDTANQVLYTYDGTNWDPIVAGGVDVQAAAAAPANRSTGATLVDGDLYYNTTEEAIYAWNGTAWVKSAPQFDWQSVAGSPITLATATRSSGGALVDGDQAWDSTNDQLYVWNGTSWALAGQKKVVVTATSLTANPGEYIVVTAATQTITLPATPTVGTEVVVVVAGTFTDTVVARNGSNIMSLAEDITLDKAYAAMVFTYVDATNGWRLN